MHLQLSSRMQEQQPHLLPMPPSQNTDPGQPTPMEIEELSDSEGLYGDAGQSTGGSKPHAAAAQRDDTAGDGERLCPWGSPVTALLQTSHAGSGKCILHAQQVFSKQCIVAECRA